MNKFSPSHAFKEIKPGIFLVTMPGNNDLAYTFLRSQEFYESVSPDFQGKKFTWQEYVDWYSSQSKTGKFTYGEDWKGFNVPSNVINACYEINEERTEYDEFFLSLVEKAKNMAGISGLKDFYMIGVREGDEETLDHEIAHGMFTVNKDYNKEMVALVYALPLNVKKYLTDYLKDLGYAESVHVDEIQAYMSTGLRKDMDKEMLVPLMEQFEKVFKSYM